MQDLTLLFCCVFRRVNPFHMLLAASLLVLAGLIFFQYQWMNRTRQLSAEIFEQKVTMALCSTLEGYAGSATCSNPSCSLLCGEEDGAQFGCLDSSLIHNTAFLNDLQQTLAFYKISLPFTIAESETVPCAPAGKDSMSCFVNIPSSADQAAGFVSLTFPEKDAFIEKKMGFMAGASYLIIFLTAGVLFLANYWLRQQVLLRRRNTILYNEMAHSFRTPLTNIRLAAQFLKTEKDPSKFIDIIAGENNRLIHQVEDVLHASRLDHPSACPKNTAVPLKALLSRVCKDLEVQVTSRQATVQLEDIDEHLTVRGEADQLYLVFQNLIENALKYSNGHPAVTISAQSGPDQLIITVDDNGIGIPPDELKVVVYLVQTQPPWR